MSVAYKGPPRLDLCFFALHHKPKLKKEHCPVFQNHAILKNYNMTIRHLYSAFHFIIILNSFLLHKFCLG